MEPKYILPDVAWKLLKTQPTATNLHLGAKSYRKPLGPPLIFLRNKLNSGSIGPCDVTKKEDLENLVAEISKKEKYINVLICSAGISGPKAEPESEKATRLKETLFKGESFQEWADTYNTNVSAVYVSALLLLTQKAERN